MRTLNYSILIFCLALAVTGCKQQPQSIPTISPQTRFKILTQLQSWQANGRAAIRDKDQGHNVSMEWQQRGQNYNLYFYGPLASGSARIIGTPEDVTLTTSDGKTYKSDSPEALVFEHLGWDLPFSGLIYWLKGLPAPHSSASIQKFDQYNQLQMLEQDGWQIEYQNYQVYSDITLPGLIKLSNHDLKLKFIIHSWQK